MKYLCSLLFVLCSLFSFSQEIALLKYKGGGDWYANPTSLPNLIKFCNTNINTKINPKPQTVETGSIDIFQYPFIHMTGHGNVFFNDVDSKNLRNYLISGGFLHIDDNYGMQPYIVKELKKIFPNSDLVELPSNHPIFNIAFKFPNGLPKIHEHDGKRPQAFGIFYEGRLVLLFTYESDLGDGWEDEEIHNDPADVRLKALQMGANIIKYAFEN
ncbi:FIG01042082: hypothetical protein [hydrothermal vent metagenome]|uniref:DUF4159 domain-containing protein n=1 Tax=hydrothermal vent metagenome TaxID=652676 RepID=A0A3B0R3A2_9ZZZZ